MRDRAEEIKRDAKEYFVPCQVNEPIVVRGRGALVGDINGRQYIDCMGGPGVLNMGHCHPKVTEAAKRQIDLLTQSPGQVYNAPTVALAKKLSEITPSGIKKVFFCNSGAEAVDGAIKLGLKYAIQRGKGGFGIVALDHAFHGRLSLPLSLTGLASRKKGFGPYATFPGVTRISAPYCYRCPLKYPDCGLHCVAELEEAFKVRAPGDIAIFIAEPILGVGGVIIPPDDYWPRVKEILDKNDVLLIFDEIFAGFGRTGKMFASQHWNVVPGIMTTAKSIGAGFPLGAFIAQDEVANAMAPGDHFTTFGGNNVVSAAAGLAGIEAILEEELTENAAGVGAHLLTGLRRLMEGNPNIGDVRGKGLMIGVEIVKSKETKEPDSERTKRIATSLRDHGVLVNTTGANANVIRITPPLVLSTSQADDILMAMGEVLLRA